MTAEAVHAAADADRDEQTLFADERRAEFTAQVDSRTHIAAGGEVELAVHVDGLHFFDVETGEALAPPGAAVSAAG